jgi:hypothetical protein
MLGGAGNPVGGSNPTGIGATLNYIGDHAYGYSGAVTVSNSSETLLDFTTGDVYITAKFAFGLDRTNAADANKDYGYRIKVNDQIVIENFTFSDGDGTMVYGAADTVLPIIIEPQSRIVIECFTNDDNITCYGVLTGRVYN